MPPPSHFELPRRRYRICSLGLLPYGYDFVTVVAGIWVAVSSYRDPLIEWGVHPIGSMIYRGILRERFSADNSVVVQRQSEFLWQRKRA